MKPYPKLIAGVEIQTAAAPMAALSTAHTYTSVIVERAAKPPATMFPIVQRLGSAKESRLGLNFRILCANWPISTSSAS
jgi:hypothetical protein